MSKLPHESEWPRLSETRKADRKKIIALIAGLCDQHQIRYEIEEPFLNRPNSIAITIKSSDGLAVTIDLEGRSPQPNVHVLPWHFNVSNDLIIAPGFSGVINEFHHRKATEVCHGTVNLLRRLRVQLAQIADGRATIPNPDKK